MRAAATIALALLAGCALVKSSKPIEVRYFTPREAEGRERVSEVPGDKKKIALHITHVESSAHLRERIAWRASPVEIALYDTRRWSDPPDVYVQRAIEKEFYDRRGVTQTLDRDGPELDVELIEFEEVVAPKHLGRVQLRYRLRDKDQVLERGTIVAERPVAGQDFANVVDAIGAALDQAAEQLADEVMRRLRT
jgi:ABC-type uncharacterized transport system auxiliary subunit